MSVDRYTKLILTVIAVCLVWLSVGGPSLITPAEAQVPVGDRVILSGWVDENGNVRRFPNPPPMAGSRKPGDPGPTASFGFPVWNQ